MEHRRFSQTMASEWQTAFAVSHKMPGCALLTVVKNCTSLEKLQDFFFKTETKTKCSRPRLDDPRPRLSFLSSRHLETKTLISRTTSLLSSKRFALMLTTRPPRENMRETQKHWNVIKPVLAKDLFKKQHSVINLGKKNAR